MGKLRPFEKTAEWLTMRIHLNPKNPEYKTFCERQFDSFISCYETHSNRPHVHILCKIKVSRSKQIENLIKKMFNIFGNTDFSIKNVNPETQKDLHEVSKYTCKGDDRKTLPCVMFKSLDWTDEKIKELHAEYHEQSHIEDTAEVIRVDLNQIEIEPKKKIIRKTWTQKIIEELETEYEDLEWDWRDKKHKQFMLDYVLRKLGETRKIFNEYDLKKFVYACFNSLDAKNFRTDVSAKAMILLD